MNDIESRLKRIISEQLNISQADVVPDASAVASLLSRVIAAGAVPLDSWEPRYGRLAEAQVKWEAAHGRPLSA